MLQSNCALEVQGEVDPGLNSELSALIRTFSDVCKNRPEVLFREFLPKGYRLTTLDSVRGDLVESVVFSKSHLGMMISLYDDLADHPQHRNPALLEALYQLNLTKDRLAPPRLVGKDRAIFELARHLFFQLGTILKRFPNY